MVESIRGSSKILLSAATTLLSRCAQRATAATKAAHEVPQLRPLYLDVQATSPMDPRVVDAMMPYMISAYGNPHSRTHFYGWEAEEAVEKARTQVANLIGADSREIVFTSGATESNNTAIKGVTNFYKDTGKDHVITVQTEHKCVLDSCRYLSTKGFKVTYLPVQNNGIISLEVCDSCYIKAFVECIRK
ncbi:unnamed protein product [Gongylonema pulchrum]|uniref:Cysteine desulfurase, mitochondrial n=1 Tax=Gongylonema pulchrum TaxID=637853 RepID=A0A183DVC8_9BILA|nr:unnamed protein product [Gongylonema pulchrum]